ncbi:hypothetical protein [Lacipirellula sp.]
MNRRQTTCQVPTAAGMSDERRAFALLGVVAQAEPAPATLRL